MIHIGIDPGVSGAIATMVDDVLVTVDDMPTLEDGPKGRRTVNAQLLAEIIANTKATRAFVEKVGPMPNDGVVGSFTFGRNFGVIQGVLAALSIRVDYIRPQDWRAYHGLSKEAKDASRSKAISMWPDGAKLFARKKDDGRAESALIAMTGLRMEK